MIGPETSLQLGIAAYKAGEKEKARTYLLKAVREQPESEKAWGWLSNTTANNEERIYCLRQVVRINPANKSAEKLLSELEGNDWLTAGPPPSSPANVVGTSVTPATAQSARPAIQPAARSDTIQTGIMILLIVTILFWLGVGFLQLVYAFDPFNFELLFYGGTNIVISALTGFLVVPIHRKQKKGLDWLYILALLGSIGGIVQIFFSGAYIQVCAVPLYIGLGILAYINRDLFVN